MYFLSELVVKLTAVHRRLPNRKRQVSQVKSGKERKSGRHFKNNKIVRKTFIKIRGRVS